MGKTSGVEINSLASTDLDLGRHCHLLNLSSAVMAGLCNL